MDFAQLKSMSGKKSLEALNAELNKITASTDKNKKNENEWKPTVDKAGNGYAVIRFLPAPAGEDVPFVRIFDHGFQGPTGLWYIEKSLTTLGKQDPVSEYNTKLWNSNSSDDSIERKQVRKQKRRLHYYSNIYVEQDSNNPECEGKVFLFCYGKKIFDKLNEAMNPQFDDEEPMNPFDLWNGASFKLKIRNVEGYRNYDKSEFNKPGPLFDDDEKMESIWKQCQSLQALMDPSNFKSYDDLKLRLLTVLNDTSDTMPKAEKLAESMPKAVKETVVASIPEEDADDSDSLEFFAKLANK